MINIVLFSKYREIAGCSSLSVVMDGFRTVDALVQHLASHTPAMAEVLADQNLCIAVNQELASRTYELNDGDEVAFFPPVTGG